MQSDLSFFIAMNGAPYPVRFEAEVLDEFERDHAEYMDGELRKFSDEWFGPTFFLERENRLGVIAQLIRDAVKAENGVLVAKYVLWMSSRYPEIGGINIQEDTYEFIADTLNTLPSDGPDGHCVH